MNAVIASTSESLHGWLERWSPAAEWGVAIGTALLAAATFYLARKARSEAEAVRNESAQVAEQIALQRQQGDAAIRPVVYPSVGPYWAEYANTQTQLVLVNGGPGVALNVLGELFRRASGGAGLLQSWIYGGSVAPGSILEGRLSQPLDSWEGVVGHLTYSDVIGRRWRTDFRITLGLDRKPILEEAEAPVLDEDEKRKYPPREWRA